MKTIYHTCVFEIGRNVRHWVESNEVGYVNEGKYYRRHPLWKVESLDEYLLRELLSGYVLTSEFEWGEIAAAPSRIIVMTEYIQHKSEKFLLQCKLGEHEFENPYHFTVFTLGASLNATHDFFGDEIDPQQYHWRVLSGDDNIVTMTDFYTLDEWLQYEVESGYELIDKISQNVHGQSHYPAAPTEILIMTEYLPMQTKTTLELKGWKNKSMAPLKRGSQ